MPRLENWSIWGKVVVGEVFDNPKFKDGTVIRTSEIVHLDETNNTVKTKNTLYELGTPLLKGEVNE